MSLPAAGTEEPRAIRPRRKFEGHTREVRDVIHLPGGQRIMTCSWDGSVRVWNLESGEQIGNNWRDDESGVNSIALSLDGKKVVSGSDDGAVTLWNIDTGKVITKWMGHTRSVTSVRWNRDGGRVLSGSEDGTVRVWDIESGETILAIKTRLVDVWAVAYSPDMTMIATGGKTEEGEEKFFLQIWDAKSGKLVTNVKGHTRDVWCLAWTADGTTLISGSADQSIRMWNTTNWQQINVLSRHTGLVYDIALSPNGRILASASWDNTLRLWNFENGQPIASPLQHAHFLSHVSFSTDGKILATGCNDKNAYTWDVSTIVREAGLDELLLNPNEDATRRPGRRRRDNINPDRPLPPGFFDDSPRHPPPSRRRPISPSSARQHHVARNLSLHERTLLDRVSSLFRRNHYNTHDMPPRPRFLQYRFFNPPRGQNDESIDLQERASVVDVPLAQGNPRNYSAREARMKKEKEKAKDTKNANNAKKPAQGSITQQSGEAAQAQRPSVLHAAVPTSSTTPAVLATSAVTTLTTSLPDATITRAGRWTRFRLFICCVSAQYTDSHN